MDTDKKSEVDYPQKVDTKEKDVAEMFIQELAILSKMEIMSIRKGSRNHKGLQELQQLVIAVYPTLS